MKDDLVAAARRLGMTEEEAERAARDTRDRLEWRLRRGRKACSSCHEEKPVGEFGRDGSRRDGLEPRCRSCRSSKRRSATVQAHSSSRRG